MVKILDASALAKLCKGKIVTKDKYFKILKQNNG